MSEDRFRIPVARGAAVGLVAWVVGYLVTYVAAIERVRADVRVQAVESGLGRSIDWQAVGWLFYNAHAVDTRFPSVSIVSSGNRNALAGNDGTVLVLFLLPPILLFLAGAIVTWRGQDDLTRLSDAGIAGSTVTVGYLFACVVGLYTFGVPVGEGTIRPHPIGAVVLAGVVFPAFWGGFGGALVGLALVEPAEDRPPE